MENNLPLSICLSPQQSNNQKVLQSSLNGYSYVYTHTDTNGNNCYQLVSGRLRRRRKKTIPVPPPSCPECICTFDSLSNPIPLNCVDGVLVLPNGGGSFPVPPYFIRFEPCIQQPIFPILVYTLIGSLPPGLMFTSLGGSGAQITGTPTTPGTYTFQISVTLQSGICTPTFSITILP